MASDSLSQEPPRKVVWVDWVNGDDANDGSCPEKAVVTGARVYELLASSPQPEPQVVTLVLGGDVDNTAGGTLQAPSPPPILSDS